MYPSGEKRFLVINLITIISLFVLILAGGVVRGTGSGMGCPDWPKCFGNFVPPTNVSQLPEGYKDKYVAERVAKNERFAHTLDVLGYGELAQKIIEDKSILEPEEFNVSKTWTEYVNRLIGVLTGFFLILCAIASVVYRKSKKRIFYLSLVNLLLVIFQGWLGSIVVSTNLMAWIVTVHMLLALGIIAISIYTYFEAKKLRDSGLIPVRAELNTYLIAIFSLLLTTFQIVLGTEVREQVDAVSSTMDRIGRTEWLEKVGYTFNWHRDFAIAVLVLSIALFIIVRRKYGTSSFQFRYALYALLFVVMQAVSGIVLERFALPGAAQAIHVFVASLLFGSQFYLILLLNPKKIHLQHLNTRT
ncbi:MAG: heme synthase [Sphingobacteriaceae bacterium]|jgi:cytochrome c oxidase assembly protein subunit 15|nr:heme synthase [Sphingobacteriaceae bacterium]